MMQMQYLQIFADKEALLAPFDDAERGRLFTAMLAYALHGEEIPLTGNERYIWPVFKQMIDQSREALEGKRKAGQARQQTAADHQQEAAQASSCQQNAADGSSGQQTAADHQQTAAQGDIIQESRIKNQELRNKKKNEGEERARAARFTPPTVEMVAGYATEAGIRLNASQFVDFYASKGWKVGKEPMRDWKAAARNWARRDEKGEHPPNAIKRVGAQMYTQRTYTETELADDVTNDILREARGQ